MYSFGTRSRNNLDTCRVDLVQVAELVMSWQVMDFAIICGHRNQEAQTQAYLLGNSKKQWPKSWHNTLPSNALDFAPWGKLKDGRMGVPWDDTHSFAMLGGLFIAAAKIRGTRLRYGGDWDGDGSTKDQTLMDWGHVEVLTT
jgi:peptidoglycan L-alanyl-D-glutamate endopeptidase CwlK